MGTSACALSGFTRKAVFGRLIPRFRSMGWPRFDQNGAEYKALFFWNEKQGSAKVNHCISHIAGIVSKFNTKQITHPLFTSQDASLKIRSTKKTNFK
jgi:hypothetical protein